MKRAKSSAVTIKAVTTRPAETTRWGQDLTSANISGHELGETYPWPVISAQAPPIIPKSPPTATRNRYDDLTDSDDEVSEVVNALAQLASTVQLGVDKAKSQSKRKSKRNHRGLDLAHMKSVAQQVINGDVKLPDLNMEDTNSEYDCCWALVDSGAGVICATR